MKLAYNKKIYSKLALVKAAYNFTDEYYVCLDLDNDYYYVEIVRKDHLIDCDIENKFSNELLAQTTRYEILRKTSTIRELILARAFASTIIETSNSEYNENDVKVNNDELFKDWYEDEI